MRALVSSFSAPKGGNAPEEFEDAYYPPSDGQVEGEVLRFAVSDGATEGMLSGKWAEILVKAFCRTQSDSSDVREVLERSHTTWSRWKTHYLADRQRRKRPVQWFEEPGMKRGAFATLLGMSLVSANGEGARLWQAIAVGDSCLFQVREGKLINSFPLSSSKAFNNSPLLLASNPGLNQQLGASLVTARGDWEVHDTFLLMTDALAKWFLEEHEGSATPWVICKEFGTQGAAMKFDGWVHALRTESRLRNDDVTLLRIDVA